MKLSMCYLTGKQYWEFLSAFKTRWKFDVMQMGRYHKSQNQI